MNGKAIAATALGDSSNRRAGARVWVVLTVLAALLLPQVAHARGILFSEARMAARSLAPDVQLAERRVDASNADVEVAGVLANPTLTLSTSRETARIGTSLAVPLPLFGQRSSSVKAARADATVAFLEVEVTRRETRWRATVAWLDLWEAQEHAKLLELAASDADRLFQIANQRFDSGTGPRLDVIRTRADRARARSEAEAAGRLVRAAAARLAPWIGASWSDDLVATGTPGYPEDLSVALPGLLERLSDHPLLHRDRAQATAAALHIRNEERLRWPVVTPQIAVNQSDPTLPGTDFIVGISVDLPLLNLRGGAVARARAQAALSEVTRFADARRLHGELLDAYQRTEGAAVLLKTLRDEVLPAMQETRDMTEEGYRSGRLDLLRLLEAQRALLENRLAETGAVASWNRAVADLENAAGVDFPEGSVRAP